MGWDDDPDFTPGAQQAHDWGANDPVVGAQPMPQGPPQSQGGAFPTPGQTLGRGLYGAAMLVPRAIGSMVMHPQDALVDPLTIPFREAAAMAGYGESPTKRQIEGIYGTGKALFTPAYKAATSGAGTITPEEMNQASETGGAAIAALAGPKVISKAAPVVARAGPMAGRAGTALAEKVGTAVSAARGANVGEVLRFVANSGATEIAAQAMGVPPGVALIGRAAMAIFKHPNVSKVGTISMDSVINAARSGDVKATAEAVARVAEKNPEVAKVVAQAVSEEAAAPTVRAPSKPAIPEPVVHEPSGAQIVQVVGPNGDRVVLAVKRGAKGGSDFDPLVTDKAGKHELQPEKISRRVGNDDWQEALKEQGYDPDEVIGFAHFGPNPKQLSPGMVYVAPELRRQGLASAMYDAAKANSGLPIGRGVLRPEGAAFRHAYDRRGATMPQPGNVKMPTVYSNPKTPAGKPLTARERNTVLEELQRKAAEDSGLDIWEAFGMERPN